MAVLNFDLKPVTLASGDHAKAVFLTGSIDASTNQQFESKLTEILASGTRHVLLVLTNVKYINSTGLGTIVKCVDTFREKGGDIKLVGVPTKVIALFEMLGLLALFETHDTIEAAVASFAKGAAPVTAEKPQAKFPLQFKHPVTGMGLNVSQPGRFKDPRTGDYFSVDQAGIIEFYEMNKVKMTELKMPCDIDMSSALASMASGLATRCEHSDALIAVVQKAVSEAASMIRARAGDNGETCTVLMVSDKDRFHIGFVNHGNALNIATDDPSLAALREVMDEVKHVVLPSRGYLLTMSKSR